MNNTVSTEVEMIHRKHIFRKIIFDSFIYAEFPFARFFVGQHIGNLIIKNPIVFLCDKIDFPIFQFSDFDFISPRYKLDKYDIFQRSFNIFCI